MQNCIYGDLLCSALCAWHVYIRFYNLHSWQDSINSYNACPRIYQQSRQKCYSSNSQLSPISKPFFIFETSFVVVSTLQTFLNYVLPKRFHCFHSQNVSPTQLCSKNSRSLTTDFWSTPDKLRQSVWNFHIFNEPCTPHSALGPSNSYVVVSWLILRNLLHPYCPSTLTIHAKYIFFQFTPYVWTLILLGHTKKTPGYLIFRYIWI